MSLQDSLQQRNGTRNYDAELALALDLASTICLAIILSAAAYLMATFWMPLRRL